MGRKKKVQWRKLSLDEIEGTRKDEEEFANSPPDAWRTPLWKGAGGGVRGARRPFPSQQPDGFQARFQKGSERWGAARGRPFKGGGGRGGRWRSPHSLRGRSWSYEEGGPPSACEEDDPAQSCHSVAAIDEMSCEPEPPLAGVVMQQAYPGGPVFSIPVQWTPFIDPSLVPGDVSLTPLDPTFMHVVDLSAMSSDGYQMLPVPKDDAGFPVPMKVKVDASGNPVQVDPGMFTVSLSDNNAIPEDGDIHEEHPTVVEDTSPCPSSEDEQIKGEVTSDSSDSQYASMSDGSLSPTTPAPPASDVGVSNVASLLLPLKENEEKQTQVDVPVEDVEDQDSTSVLPESAEAHANKIAEVTDDQPKVEEGMPSETNTSDPSASEGAEEENCPNADANNGSSEETLNVEAEYSRTIIKQGYVMVPILTPYYDPSVLYGFQCMHPGEVLTNRPMESSARRKKKKANKKRQQEKQDDHVHVDSRMFAGEPLIATPDGFVVPVDEDQLCQLHDVQVDDSGSQEEKQFENCSVDSDTEMENVSCPNADSSSEPSLATSSQVKAVEQMEEVDETAKEEEGDSPPEVKPTDSNDSGLSDSEEPVSSESRGTHEGGCQEREIEHSSECSSTCKLQENNQGVPDDVSTLNSDALERKQDSVSNTEKPDNFTANEKCFDVLDDSIRSLPEESPTLLVEKSSSLKVRKTRKNKKSKKSKAKSKNAQMKIIDLTMCVSSSDDQDNLDSPAFCSEILQLDSAKESLHLDDDDEVMDMTSSNIDAMHPTAQELVSVPGTLEEVSNDGDYDVNDTEENYSSLEGNENSSGVLSDANGCVESVVDRAEGDASKDYSVLVSSSSAVRNWVSEVSPEKTFSILEEKEAASKQVSSQEGCEESSGDDSDLEFQSNPEIVDTKDESDGSRAALSCTEFLSKSTTKNASSHEALNDDNDDDSMISIVNSSRLHSECSSSLPFSSNISSDDETTDHEVRNFSPSICNKLSYLSLPPSREKSLVEAYGTPKSVCISKGTDLLGPKGLNESVSSRNFNLNSCRSFSYHGIMPTGLALYRPVISSASEVTERAHYYLSFVAKDTVLTQVKKSAFVPVSNSGRNSSPAPASGSTSSHENKGVTTQKVGEGPLTNHSSSCVIM